LLAKGFKKHLPELSPQHFWSACNGAKNINDCPAQTLKFNAAYGQSFMFFVQVKAASRRFDLKASCGGCDSFLLPMLVMWAVLATLHDSHVQQLVISF